MKVTGRCHCGAVRFEAEVDPDQVEVCHCTDCQQLSGSAFRAVVPALPNTFRLLSGTLSEYVKMADSGNRRIQGFCVNCGSPIYGKPAGSGDRLVTLRFGTIDQRGELMPKAQFWTKSAQDWTGHIAGLPGREGN